MIKHVICGQHFQGMVNMASILEPMRKTWNLDTNDERCGVACGNRWAMTATADELVKLAALVDSPGFLFWFDGAKPIITPERLVDIIGDATHSSFECVDFWNQNFGDSDRHVAIWRTPAFTKGFVIGVPNQTHN